MESNLSFEPTPRFSNFFEVPKLKFYIKKYKEPRSNLHLVNLPKLFRNVKIETKGFFEKEDPTTLVTTNCKGYHVHVSTMLNILCYSCSSHKNTILGLLC
jgi:hypothetical protein